MDAHTLAVILGALLAISEALSLIPAVRSNSIFQLITNILGSIKGSTNTTAQ